MKTVIITGASQGLGLVVANRFAEKGWKVIGTGRSDRPSELASTVGYEQFDASNAKENESFWQRIKGDLDGDVCLVNNAGSYVSGGLLETSSDDYEKQIKSVYFTAVHTTRELAKAVTKARIINVISSSALAAHSENSAYGAAKAAETHFFQSLQLEFKPSKYQITNLYPSSINSHGEGAGSIEPVDLADFIVEQADTNTSYYLRDVTLYPLS